MTEHHFRNEIVRKFLHLLEIPVLVMYTLVRHLSSERWATLALTGVLILLLQMEYARLEYRVKFPKFMMILLRNKEIDHVTGTIFFICATIIVFAAFDYSVALTALLLTVFGDLSAALVGIKFGKHHLYHDKTLEGFLGGFMVNLLIGFLMMPEYPLIFGAMALTASLVELFTKKLDDNLTVPLFSAFVGQILVFYMNAPLSAFPGPIVGGVLNLIFPVNI